MIDVQLLREDRRELARVTTDTDDMLEAIEQCRHLMPADEQVFAVFRRESVWIGPVPCGVLS